MTDNPQADLARTLIETTDAHVFLTGKAGTGKTTFLRRLRSESPKRMAVLAPTGIAAINAGGMTIHSFFQLPFSPFIPGMAGKEKLYKMSRAKLDVIRSIDLLVIDEISMVRADLLDAIDDALRKFRHSNVPFGGVQLLLIGDLQQLAPVVKDEEWALLCEHYETPFFFSSHALKRTNYVTVELLNVYRQSDADFLSLLNNIREGVADAATMNAINKRYIPHFSPNKEEGYIRLVTHNWLAQQINEDELAKLPVEEMEYRAEVSGKFPEYAYPTDSCLRLKAGAQVMFVKNDPEKRYYNGMIGEVVEIEKGGCSVRPLEAGAEVLPVGRVEWSNTRYVVDDQTKEIKEETDGTFVQYPVKLAWAITIHKSQGLTFDKVMIDASRSFAHGQTYVALSRCRTLRGIVLTAPIPPAAVIADPHVSAFNREMRAYHISGMQLSQLQNAYETHLLAELFNFEKERIALSQVVRILEMHLADTYPETLSAYRQTLEDFDLSVMAVSNRFHHQYVQLLAANDGDIEDSNLQRRVKKGAAYFAGKLDAIGNLAKHSHMEVDNTAVARQLKNASKELERQRTAHTHVLERTAEAGFSAKDYLAFRAKEALKADEKVQNSEKKTARGRQKEVRPQYEVPSEVKHAALYLRLREWRRKKSEETGKPAYVILQTKAMLALSNYLPSDEHELLAIPYLGRKGCDLYGGELLAMVREYAAHPQEDEVEGEDKTVPSAQEIAMQIGLPGEKTQNTTLRLYRQGHTPEEIAILRELSLLTVKGHLARFVKSGEVSLEDLVPADHLRRIKDYLAAHPRTPETTLTEIREAVGEDVSFDDIRLALSVLSDGWTS